MKALEAAEKCFEGYGLQSLRENLLDKMMGAPGLAFETRDPARKRRQQALQPVRNSFATNAALAAEGALYARTFGA